MDKLDEYLTSIAYVEHKIGQSFVPQNNLKTKSNQLHGTEITVERVIQKNGGDQVVDTDEELVLL